MSLFAGSLAACMLAALCAGGPTVANQTSLVLSLHGADGTDRSVQLICEPDAGTHPRAHEACSALESAGGDFEQLPVKDQMCPLIYSPTRAEAHGHWNGEPVSFTAEYSNSCQADAESGGVFGF